jgi:Asp-tRNA(Asn)/Glu-tRNA(Gln) amidotransferase C subunit
MEFGRKNRESFWPSYVDIMTTLFAVMLILFAVSYARFKLKEGQLEMLVNEYKDIIDVYSTVDAIDKTGYYAYDKQYLKHTLTVSIAYQDKEYDISNKLQYDLTNKTKADQVREKIRRAGREVQNIISDLEENSENSKNIKFLIVIEGQSSKIPFNDNDWQNNETLSYLRAKFLKKFWTDPVSEGGCGLFQRTSENDVNSKCEIIVAGSGEGGVPRYYYKGGINPMSQNPAEEKYSSIKNVSPEDFAAWRNVEQRNQRFLINIIPIIGNIDVTKAKFENIKK